jgi:hypothetical protein
LSCFFSAAAAENLAARLAAIWIVSPDAGLRSSRAARPLTLNLPKPGDRDLAARGELAGDRVDRGVDGARGLLAGEAGVRGDLLGDSCLVMRCCCVLVLMAGTLGSSQPAPASVGI